MTASPAKKTRKRKHTPTVKRSTPSAGFRRLKGDPAKKPLRPPRRATIRQVYTRCARKGCKICGGERYAHGPFAYAYAARPGGGTWSWYLGKR